MDFINPIAIVVAAVSAMVVGFVWYNPKVFGNAWMTAAGITEAQIKGTNALFERKGAMYILINAGYWIVTLGIMGGIVCGWR